MAPVINWKKICLFILFSYGISWTVAGIMMLLNFKSGTITSTILIALLYMPGPAIATFIIQKFIYKDGFKKYGWRIGQKSIKWLLITPILFILLIFLTFVVIAALGNTNLIEAFGRIDFSQEGFSTRFFKLVRDTVGTEEVEAPPFPPELFLLLIILQGIIAGSTVNVPFMFGEEFGWRGLLLRETQNLKFIKSNLFIGFTWGLWHLPVILMGHNYPENPYWGILIMCLFATSVSPLFSYIRLKTKTILGPCILHGMINATGALFVLYIANGHELYSSIAGW